MRICLLVYEICSSPTPVRSVAGLLATLLLLNKHDNDDAYADDRDIRIGCSIDIGQTWRGTLPRLSVAGLRLEFFFRKKKQQNIVV